MMIDWFDPPNECDGSGVILLPCRGDHRYPCGGDECDDGERDCDGCDQCSGMSAGQQEQPRKGGT